MTADANAGRVVVVTGASAGVGRAIARAFGARGMRVGLLARGVDGLAACEREIEAAGGSALAIPTDVADAEAVDAAAGRIERELGPIDVWVNDAMVTIFCEFQSIGPDDFRRATEVSYLGAVWGTRAALARMRPRNAGIVIHVGSALAYRSIPMQSAYCGAKSALRGFTDSLRSELIHDGIGVRLTMVQLAAFNTPQFEWARACRRHRPQPLPPIHQPELAARAVLWAADHDRREIWVGWPAVKAILGTRLVPGLLDLRMAKQAVDGQFDDQTPAEGRPDNLYEAVDGDHGAHGRFDDRARDSSRQLYFALHRGITVALAVLALAVVAVVLWWLVV